MLGLLRRLFLRDSVRSILFYRDFQFYTGGHQKVADYFGHSQECLGLHPSISFSAETLWDETNPWVTQKGLQVDFEPEKYDYLFLAGLDWLKYREQGLDPDLPVLNLIQHVRHADPESDLYQFLSEKAVRICVSQQVADAILATGKVNGPVFAIPNGHKIEFEPLSRERDVYILGSKQRVLAGDLIKALEEIGFSVVVTDSFVPRSVVLSYMASSSITLLLPNHTEGFYLPALEAMKLSDLTIVPDCVGNRSFCHHRVNCLMPALNLDEMTLAVEEAASILNSPNELATYTKAAHETVKAHSLADERRQFIKIVQKLPRLWRGLG